MAISKVYVDEETCTGCGLCADACPEVFEVNEVAHVIADSDLTENEEAVLEAADNCPVDAISYEEF